MTSDGRDQQQASSTPTRPAPKPPGLASVLARNIEALQKRRVAGSGDVKPPEGLDQCPASPKSASKSGPRAPSRMAGVLQVSSSPQHSSVDRIPKPNLPGSDGSSRRSCPKPFVNSSRT